MISTGTDVKPIECVFFMRNVKSAGFFEQMKGRGVRVISPDKLRVVTPSARVKDRFIIVDAVGVCEQDKTESRTLNRKPSATLPELLNYVAQGGTDPDALITLAGRLGPSCSGTSARTSFANCVRARRRQVFHQTSRHDLLNACDPDAQLDAAQVIRWPRRPAHRGADRGRCRAARAGGSHAVPQGQLFRRRILEIRTQNEQTHRPPHHRRCALRRLRRLRGGEGANQSAGFPRLDRGA